ncbi:MAG: hypothetical protein WA743_02710 [Pseudolabrys sp.]
MDISSSVHDVLEAVWRRDCQAASFVGLMTAAIGSIVEEVPLRTRPVRIAQTMRHPAATPDAAEHQAIDTVNQVKELIAGRMPARSSQRAKSARVEPPQARVKK